MNPYLKWKPVYRCMVYWYKDAPEDQNTFKPIDPLILICTYRNLDYLNSKLRTLSFNQAGCFILTHVVDMFYRQNVKYKSRLSLMA